MKKLYYGGTILTMVHKGDCPEALIEEEGKICYVGSYEKAKKICGEQGQEIDLKGKTLMPAFIDPHSHFSQVAQSVQMCDLSETESFSQIAESLTEYIEKNHMDATGVVFASGYDHNFLEEEVHPDKKLLDEVSDQIPIYISHASGHMGVANSAMLQLSGVTDDTEDPKGGRFGRYEDGSLNGYVEETPALMKILMPAMARMKGDLMVQMEAAEKLYLKNGITTVQEGAAMGQAMQMLASYGATGRLKLDVVVYILADDYEKTVAQFSEYNGIYKNRVKIGGAKVILDGSPQGKSAWLSMPYEGEESYCGYPTHEDSYVEEVVSNAVKGGYQILAHCNGDAASEQFIRSIEKAYEKQEGAIDADLRPVMIHCQTARKDQMERMANLHIIPSIFVGHTYYWGDIHLKNLGPIRGAAISPVRTALDLHMPYNFHQDAPVTKPNMLHSVWCAVNRRTRRGQSIGQEQCIDVYDALKAITIHGAYEYHEEKQKGTLEAGKLADMVILDRNPMEVPKQQMKDITVLTTIKEGKVVYQV
ncbi:MAG: amidohydrolase [Anaerostipes sp.]|uniref:amidohydrolase n=1 Tax=Anaerostipes sp. 992a TaxID=1261637 RepID=UPI00095285BA|nr:amidohydrolase [Anaerostipes sp. 992a]MCI5952392.1 amidohydrolase [Anaerostipes sp.]MDD5970013.1 amidohydrolase [Anaerostipes sp.]OLR63716.1 amidohydrolase [Anaerostipes sp. 992a]